MSRAARRERFLLGGFIHSNPRPSTALHLSLEPCSLHQHPSSLPSSIDPPSFLFQSRNLPRLSTYACPFVIVPRRGGPCLTDQLPEMRKYSRKRPFALRIREIHGKSRGINGKETRNYDENERINISLCVISNLRGYLLLNCAKRNYTRELLS